MRIWCTWTVSRGCRHESTIWGVKLQVNLNDLSGRCGTGTWKTTDEVMMSLNSKQTTSQSKWFEWATWYRHVENHWWGYDVLEQQAGVVGTRGQYGEWNYKSIEMIWAGNVVQVCGKLLMRIWCNWTASRGCRPESTMWGVKLQVDRDHSSRMMGRVQTTRQEYRRSARQNATEDWRQVSNYKIWRQLWIRGLDKE